MTPTDFPNSNARYGPPSDLEESQCQTIRAWQGIVPKGSCEGATLVVSAWQPSAAELARLNEGGPVFFSCLGTLPPHFLSTTFDDAPNPE